MTPEPPLMPGGFRPEERTAMNTLEILGQSYNGDALWVRIDDDDEFDVTPVELAVARRSVQRGYSGRLHGHWIDESQLDTLINAMNAPQPLYPPIPCRFCGVDASVLIEDEPYCHAHAAGYTAREERQ